ncbi:hypothetical protein HPB47_004493 [Ixodes persulcatus]|uniref:Uncharacterized protein n=1 Tax=Ixodes persulcatus TaxID=34615 RepID=A0AC60PGN5_IXOPE|nr:hypothetical protein HPB47_004493 [Ixodes persulcatus]
MCRGQKVDAPYTSEKSSTSNSYRGTCIPSITRRGTARVKALKKQLKTEDGVIFVVAAEYDKRLKAITAVAVDRERIIIASCSVRTVEPEVAEETLKRKKQVVRQAEDAAGVQGILAVI